MTFKSTFLIALASLLLAPAPAWAHHAFSSEFDADKPFVLNGKVVKVQWINPHSWIHIEVQTPNGSEVWMIEGGTPNTLFRRGITRGLLDVGTEIQVRGYAAKSGDLAGSGRDITLADGRQLFMGSSGTGAPKDGSDPNE
jgi:hypothetical protein